MTSLRNSPIVATKAPTLLCHYLQFKAATDANWFTYPAVKAAHNTTTTYHFVTEWSVVRHISDAVVIRAPIRDVIDTQSLVDLKYNR